MVCGRSFPDVSGSMSARTPAWDKCYDFKNIFCENFGENTGVFFKLLLYFAKI
jgi:hypothetical protein